MLCGACNSGVPEPASVELASPQLRLTLVRVATDPFLSRHNLLLRVEGPGACSASEELFPDTGHAGRRNVYRAPEGLIYLVGQFDARVVDVQRCTITLSEFRHLGRDVTFLGSFDERPAGEWAFLTPAERPEQSFDKR
jgi:hypothetical protein